MDRLNFRDDLFEKPEGAWVQSHLDEHFRQRYLRDEKLIYCETLLTVHGTIDVNAAVSLICGPWDWWEHGRITDFTANGDGSSDQILSPVWWFITRVGLHIFPPENLPEVGINVGIDVGFDVDFRSAKALRVPILLTEHFIGSSSMDVYPNPQCDSMTIRGRFHGVEYKVPAVPNALAEGLHLEAESGTMPIPFPKGTGWVGLLHKLEAASPAENTSVTR